MSYSLRLQQALSAANKTRKDLAAAVGCSVQNIGMILTNAKGTDQQFSAVHHAKAAKFLKVDAHWLATGAGEMSMTPGDAGGRIKHANEELVIPQFETGGGMGNGNLLLEDQPGTIKSWHVDHNWVRLNVKNYTSLANLCIVTGFGPSMRPMFNPGDPLLVDRGVTKVEVDAIYFFRIGDDGYIKMLQRIPDATGSGKILRAKSKNSDFDSFDIQPENPHFQVLGKVLTVWKSEQF